MNAAALSFSLLLSSLLPFQSAPPTPAPQPATAGLLQPGQIEEVLPSTVFFQNRVASTQARNSGGVRSAQGKLTEFALVDNSGYSSGIRERYQFYVLSSAALEFGGKRLAPGAYGGGFVGGHLLIMDLGGADLFQAPLSHEPELKRPRPLQVSLEQGSSDRYRLYLGRDYVAFRQIP